MLQGTFSTDKIEYIKRDPDERYPWEMRYGEKDLGNILFGDVSKYLFSHDLYLQDLLEIDNKNSESGKVTYSLSHKGIEISPSEFRKGNVEIDKEKNILKVRKNCVKLTNGGDFCFGKAEGRNIYLQFFLDSLVNEYKSEDGLSIEDDISIFATTKEKRRIYVQRIIESNRKKLKLFKYLEKLYSGFESEEILHPITPIKQF